jgi:hypothetical protein
MTIQAALRQNWMPLHVLLTQSNTVLLVSFGSQ